MTERDIIICGHGSGTPSTKNLYTYNENSYKRKASNGKRRCVISVKRLKALTDEGRQDFHDTYKTILGRNSYNQKLRSYVYSPYQGKYYSDCSSSGCATFKKIGYNISLLNTAGIYNSSLFETIDVKIVNGHITNPEILKVGDALLYIGNDPARPLQIGHVEFVYEMPTISSSSAPRSYLQKGDKGTAVKEMQEMLIYCGYDCGSSGADGSFGSGTEKALKEFQEDARLESDGKYGTASKKALTDYYNALVKEKSINKNNVSRGQNWLNTEYASVVKKCNGGKLLEIDGSYGSKTRLAVLGVWKQYMNENYDCTFTVGNANFGDSCKKAASKVNLEQRDKGILVYLAQIILSAKCYYTSTFDGSFGSGMKKAIIAFQTEANLSKDGIIGANTWEALFN